VKQLTLFFLIYCHLFVSAQDLNHFNPLRSQGALPSDFTSSSYSKYKADIQDIEKSDKRFDRKSKDQFLLYSNYFNDMILRSGKVTFGDPVTNYLNSVADIILAKDPGLREKIRIYTLKSVVANAYSMDNGIILISTGLIAKLENEAQLAFVIGHELVHFIEKHAINRYVENQKIKVGKDHYKNMTWDDREFASLSYSREDEFTADRKSIELFLAHTQYNLSEIPDIYNILNYHQQPFANIPYEITHIRPRWHTFSGDYWLEAVDSPKSAEDEDDSFSTHPNVISRQNTLRNIINGLIRDEENSSFIVSESEFLHIRNLCRFENLHLHIISRQMGQAFYNVFLLQKEFPGNYYLDKSLAYVLYVLTTYHNNNKIGEVVQQYRQISGYWQQNFYFFRTINNAELNCIALNKCWQLHQNHPEDDYLKNICSLLIKSLLQRHKIDVTDFSKTPPVHEEETGDANELLSKKKPTRKELIAYALVEIMDDDNLTVMFNEVRKQIEEESVPATKLNRKERKKLRKQIAAKGVRLGIDTILVFEPGFMKVDLTKKNENLKLIESEKQELAINNYVLDNAKRNNVTAFMLDARIFDENDIKYYNDFETIKEWLQEFYGQQNNFTVMPWTEDQIQQLIENYNTQHLYLSYYLTIKYRNKGFVGNAVLILFSGLFPLLPAYTAYHFLPKYKTSSQTMVVDMSSGKVIFISDSQNNSKIRSSWLNGIIYNQFFQIKNKH